MAKLIGRTMTGTGEVVIDDAVLAKGGEGKVHNLVSHDLTDLPDADDLVAKIYFNPEEANRGPKVAAMLKNPPADQTSIAWVKAILFDENKKFVGYLMRKLDTKNFRQWYELSNMKDRQQTAPQFDVKYAINASRNFLVAIHFIHEAGHKIGDINESNLFINADSTVMLVDMDSAQIEQNNKIYPCEVGKPEFTASEISHGKLRDNPRTIETDIFAYSVMIFQMLTGGAHPMDGVYIPDEDPPSVTEKIRMGVLPTLKPHIDKNFKPVPRIPSHAIPQRLQQALIQSLSNNPADRLDSDSYLTVIDDVLSNLVQCDKEEKHWFDERDGNCGWCLHKNAGNFDPWSDNQGSKNNKKSISQSSLPSVSFGEQKKPAKAMRAAPRVPGVPTQPQNAPNSGHQTNPQQNTSVPPQGTSNASQQSHSGNLSKNSQSSHMPQQGMSYYRPDPPRKHKGKIVLEYLDGSLRQRPPMSVLIRSNQKVAWQAFVEEFPSLIRVWWDQYRYTVKIPAVIAGFLLSMAVAFAWMRGTAQLINVVEIPFIDAEWNLIVIGLTALISGITSATASTILAISALVKRYKDIKKFGGKQSIQEENFIKTVLRFFAVALFYGTIFLLVLLFAILIGLLKFASAVVKAEQR